MRAIGRSTIPSLPRRQAVGPDRPTKRDAQGFRLLPSGRSATIVVESQSEQTEDPDALQLIAEYCKKIGIKMLVKPQTRENFRPRTFSGEALMTAYAGVVTAVPTPNTSPKEFAPTMRGGLQWPKWGIYVESGGRQGEKCDMESACRLLDYLEEWQSATDEAGRRKAWEKDPAGQRRRGILYRYRERYPPADRGWPQGAQRAQGRLLRLGPRRIYRALSARHVLGLTVR